MLLLLAVVLTWALLRENNLLLLVAGLMLRVLGVLLLLVSAFMGLSVPVALIYGEIGLLWVFLLPIGINLSVYFAGRLLVRRQDATTLSVRSGYLLVALSWLVAAGTGALPFVLSGAIPKYVDAFFETMSGFTTTGASILTNVEAMAMSLLFWRSMTHWLGGMGIVVLTVAIFPLLGIGGLKLMDAEAPGPLRGPRRAGPDGRAPRRRIDRRTRRHRHACRQSAGEGAGRADGHVLAHQYASPFQQFHAPTGRSDDDRRP